MARVTKDARPAASFAPSPRTPGRLLAAASVLAVAGLAALPPTALAGGVSPEAPHSPNAEEATTIYWATFILAVVVVVTVNAALLGAAIRFRARRGRPAATRVARRLPGRAAAGLGVLAAAVLVAGIVFTERARDVEPGGPQGLDASAARTAQLDLAVPEGAEPLTVRVSGQQWLWRYEYPDGTFSYFEMVVPVDTPVILELDSTDVLHRWWIPSLGGQFDASPVRSGRTWFKAEEEGTYRGQSAAFSGTGYPYMRAQVRAVSAERYEAWLERQSRDIQQAQAFVQKKIEQQGPGGGVLSPGEGGEQ